MHERVKNPNKKNNLKNINLYQGVLIGRNISITNVSILKNSRLLHVHFGIKVLADLIILCNMLLCHLGYFTESYNKLTYSLFIFPHNLSICGIIYLQF